MPDLSIAVDDVYREMIRRNNDLRFHPAFKRRWAPAVCRLLELKWLHEKEIEETEQTGPSIGTKERIFPSVDLNGSARCSHIWMDGRRLVHHEARLTCLEKNRESTVEVAQEEVAPTKACSKASQVMIFAVNNIGSIV